MKRLLPLLASASGMCGIAYELLYARLLTTHLGDVLQVAAGILATFLLGIAAGSAVAHRAVRRLWAIELGIGAYAGLVAWLFSRHSNLLLELALPATAGRPLALVGIVVGLLVIPATLIGFSVPLFATLLRHHADASGREAAFRRVYRLYNVGAALCVLATEFVLLRQLGTMGALVCAASLNVLTALALLTVRTPRFEPPPRGTTALPAAAVAVLFLVSIASGVYQMFFYKLVETVFGPYHENFALVLALALLGIAAGTAWFELRPVSFDRWLRQGGVFVVLALLGTAPAVWLWAALHGSLLGLPGMGTLAKICVVVLMGGVPFSVFGATVPALLRELPHHASTAGRALAVSSLGNCVGYLGAVLWLFAALPDRAIAAGVAGSLVVGGLALARMRRAAAVAWPLAMVMVVAIAWPETLLYYGHTDYASLEKLRAVRKTYAGVEVHRRLDSQLSLLQGRDGSETLVINGYRSLVALQGDRTNLSELVYGLTPALFSARRDRALVLGVGTGLTASATADVYRHTSGVELNPAVLELLPHFAAHNRDLHKRPDVELVLDDGLTALLRSPTRWDAIVNTVTTPLYFSSSKLYTRDFFDIVSSRLAPGGVYALWFDARVTQAGARIIFHTLAQSFQTCAVTFLNNTYLQLICGNEPLRARPPEQLGLPDDLRRLVAAHELGLSLEEILEALVMDRHRLFEIDWQAPINSFDRPVLEFVMAGRSPRSDDTWSPYAMIELDVASSPFSRADLSDEALARRCYLLRRAQVTGAGVGAGCVGVLLDRAGAAGLAHYAELVLSYEASQGWLLSGAERCWLSERLSEAGITALGSRLVEEYDPAPRERRDVVLTRARVRRIRGETLDDTMLSQLYASAPMDPEVREMLATALAERGDALHALAHLAFLRAIGVPSPEARVLEAELRGSLHARRAGR